MTPEEPRSHDGRSAGPTTPSLEDLVPIAVVITAGCEPCAESTVQRALRRGSPASLIERTLEIVEHIRSRECFATAVGPEVIARMARPLRAAAGALPGSARLRGNRSG